MSFGTIAEQKVVMARVASLIHSDQRLAACEVVCNALRMDLKAKRAKPTKGEMDEVLALYLRGIMEQGFLAEAAQILWTPSQFTPEPQSVKDIWNLFDTADMGLICGAASMGKSFSMGVRLLLEWCRDPQYTTVRLLGPSENHLEANLFSHIVSLHQNASIPLAGEVGGLFIGLTRRDQLSSIRGVIVPKGANKKAGRLQGSKRRPRPFPHPVFGNLSRMFIFLDEVENIARGIWADIDNIISNTEESGQGFKLFGAYNPSDPYDEVSKRAEPPFGWSNIDEDIHFKWKSTRGWTVLRLDGERCENVVQRRIIYPGLQTAGGLEKIAANAGGRNSGGYRTMGRGLYPAIGIEATVIPSGMLGKVRGEYIWFEEPVTVGATDLALEGGDEAVHTIGKWGLATGIKWVPSIEFPNGHTTLFKRTDGSVGPRWGLQAMQQFILPKGETVAMKKSVMEMNHKSGTRPEWYACDRTGHGAGVADLIRYEWSTIIHDVNYSESASEEKLMTEDSKTCKEAYDRMATELWFAMRMWFEFGYLLIHPSMDIAKLSAQLANRRFRSIAGRSKTESKKDFESRGFTSPNDADSLSLLVHAARKGSGQILSMREGNAQIAGNVDSSWYDAMYAGGARIDSTNRTDFLDENAGPEIPDELSAGGWS